MKKKQNTPQLFGLFDSIPTQPQETSVQQPLERILIDKDDVDATPSDLLPEQAYLFVLNRYGFQATDMARLLRVCAEASTSADTKTNDEIAAAAGISAKKNKTLLLCARWMGLIAPYRREVTPLGKLVIEHDPYFSQVATLWLLHYMLASNAALVVWSRIFDVSIKTKGSIFKSTDISEEYCKQYESNWASYQNPAERIRGDAFSLLKMYSEEMFTPLKLVERVNVRDFKLSHPPTPVSPLTLLSAILIYRDRFYPGASALQISQLVDLHFSPGRLLSLDENAIRHLLDELHAKRYVTIETRADLDQVRLSEEISWLDAYRKQIEGEG